jgi:2,4-dienoyl-CoA reductase-like NADH-dependent reductase (Old Yellow Enzyme family)
LADATVANEDADLVGVARGMLRDPYWAIHAVQAVAGKEAVPAPKQYARAF